MRFSPSPTRGETVNIGVVVGSDEGGDWKFETAHRSRANLIDDEGVFPVVAAEVERLAAIVERYSSDLPNFVQEAIPSERWLSELVDCHHSVLQFTDPLPVIADSAADALGQVWDIFIVERGRQTRTPMTKTIVASRYYNALVRSIGHQHAKLNPTLLLAEKYSASIDVVAHNGIVVDLTQCWSFQVKDKSGIAESVKAWAFGIERLRESGGLLIDRDKKSQYIVPKDVSVSVVYADGGIEIDSPAVSEAIEVFRNVKAEFFDINQLDSHIKRVKGFIDKHAGDGSFSLSN